MSHFKTSVSAIRRAPFQALTAIFVLALTFFVATLVTIFIYASNQIVRYIETRPQIIAFLKVDVETSKIEALQKRLGGDIRIKEITYVSREEALEIYKRATSDNPLLGELVSPSSFPASLEFSVSDLSHASSLVSELSEEEVVDSVGFTANIGDSQNLEGVINRLRNLSYNIRIGGVIAISILSITSFLVLTVVMSMRITMKREEMESLHLIGAGYWFIRIPVILEALNYAILGVFFGWLGASILVMYMTPSILTYFSEIELLPKNTTFFFLLLGGILVIELLIGILISFLGSFFAVSRSLKLKK